mmetsp:Transcript_335/g.457  ORF Transcript_335/g.457 Transcript_335/m.457 type:complete len:301 (-) Transcript_335:261-1163(-)
MSQSICALFALFFVNLLAATSTDSSTPSISQDCIAPKFKQMYLVVNNKQVSPDSNILTVKFEKRDYLGLEPLVPTCISVTHDNSQEILSKSYSPISHPSQKETFELLVKAYPFRSGGGVGTYLCGLQPGDSFEAKVKSKRIMHSSHQVVGRWSHVGLVAGGTGIAPLFQILQLLLRDDTTKISVLSINRFEHDILMKEELDEIAAKHPERVSVTYSLTGETKAGYLLGRGNTEMVREALPDPSVGDIMNFVCGKDGFVETWSGKVEREKTTDGSKGKKIQGPLLGILKEAGYNASQVFKY